MAKKKSEETSESEDEDADEDAPPPFFSVPVRTQLLAILVAGILGLAILGYANMSQRPITVNVDNPPAPQDDTAVILALENLSIAINDLQGQMDELESPPPGGDTTIVLNISGGPGPDGLLDADWDGVPDTHDAFPNDPTRAYFVMVYNHTIEAEDLIVTCSYTVTVGWCQLPYGFQYLALSIQVNQSVIFTASVVPDNGEMRCSINPTGTTIPGGIYTCIDPQWMNDPSHFERWQMTLDGPTLTTYDVKIFAVL